MKKLLILSAAVMFTGSVFAGGIVTNTNQSASWVRMPVRDASTGIEATYFNPAGLMRLNNGLHFSISNQTISQKREVENFYTGPGDQFGLNESLFKGTVSAPLFPSVYAVYKMDKLAFSFGFNPVGGGGGATFEKGLPSFEMSPSDLVPLFSTKGFDEYRLSTFFEGSSIYFGYQGGVSYKINDMVSVFAGLRYVTAKNSNQGYLKDIEIHNAVSDEWIRADNIMMGIAASATNGANDLQAAIEAEYVGANDPIGDATANSLIALGVDPTGFTNAIAVYALGQAAGKYTDNATLLGDQEVDVDQTGTGITPVFGVNISLFKLNIGIKYELATKMELQNKTEKDVIVAFTDERVPLTMFPDGAKFRNDMPAMLSVGASYEATSKLSANIGGHYYFDKNANYGKKIDGVYVKNTEVIDNNFFELAAGLEYSLTKNLIVSGGYLIARTGVNELYQSDMSNSQNSNTIGLGGKFSLNKMIGINLGLGYTIYEKSEKTFNHYVTGIPTPFSVRETYWKSNMFLGIGVDISL